MHLIGRWERVRGYRVGTGLWDPPLMLDRKWSTLSPFTCEEWHKTHDGLWVPVLRGGALSFPGQTLPLNFATFIPFNLAAAVSASTLQLNSAYTFNSAGDAVAARIVGQGKAVANLYYYIQAAANGTQSNIDDMLAELRNDTNGVRPNVVAPTLHSSGNANPNGEGTWIGWHKIGLSAFTDTYGTIYWLIVAAGSGIADPVTDFATVHYGTGSSDVSAATRLFNGAYSTTAGFTASPTSAAAFGSLLLEYGDGVVVGWSATSLAATTSDTNRKGLRHPGFTEQIKLLGAQGAANAVFTGLEVYNDDGTVPGGSTVASGSILVRSSAGNIMGALLSSAYTIPKATAQRVVFTMSAATSPRKTSIGTDNGYTTIMRAARPGGAGMYYAYANGTTDWTNDDQDAQPDMTLFFEDQVAVAGGGGLRLAGHGGLAA